MGEGGQLSCPFFCSSMLVRALVTEAGVGFSTCSSDELFSASLPKKEVMNYEVIPI